MRYNFSVLSDIHGRFNEATTSNDPTADVNVLVVAGDITNGHGMSFREHQWTLKQPQDECVYVYGNHDYYSDVLPADSHRVYTYELPGGLKVFATTMWTDLSNPIAHLTAKANMNDYRYIEDAKGNFICPKYTTKIHKKAIENLYEVVDENSVVVTHHAPSRKSLSSYGDTILDKAYYSDLAENLIIERQPRLWIHGHTHGHKDYMIGNTRVVCHAPGYSGVNVRGFNVLIETED